MPLGLKRLLKALSREDDSGREESIEISVDENSDKSVNEESIDENKFPEYSDKVEYNAENIEEDSFKVKLDSSGRFLIPPRIRRRKDFSIQNHYEMHVEHIKSHQIVSIGAYVTVDNMVTIPYEKRNELQFNTGDILFVKIGSEISEPESEQKSYVLYG